ncbi:MAPK regulated corepressor interacting protein 2-like [Hypomesus transpacificus]|uniref:MAPK regulated corepressor interacting protein 2-like n=1 Tax=Hypomesus transpacificus TaxID=137520 RepID=UPI001F0840B4|nr:MAPK regulated corepressor interacting protein 2-like [Hypomesus transpacificus]
MMYTITKGPSKLVTQRRTGPTQPIDNKINEFKHKQTPWIVADIPSPKLVFNRLNGKKHHPPPAVQVHTQSDGFTAAHEENVTFVNAAWQEVVQQVEEGPGQAQEAQGPVRYTETAPSPHMKDFMPLDLDEWWAQRFLANIDKLS